MMKKRLLSSFMAFVMLLSLLPVSAFAAPTKTDAPGEVTATKTLLNKEPDTDGNYTIQLTVQGNPITQESHSAADVVLVVDNSESMNDSVVEMCGTPSNQFRREGWPPEQVCPNCDHHYNEGEVPEFCTHPVGEPGPERMETAKEMSKTYAESILNSDSDNRMAVIGFSGKDGGSNDVIDVEQGLTRTLSDVNTALDKMKTSGATNYTAALARAKAILDSRPKEESYRPAYVIFISDGAPGKTGNSQDDPRWNGKEQADELKESHVQLITIGIDLRGTAEQYLDSLATPDEKEHAYAFNVKGSNYAVQLEKILKQWAEQIKVIPAGTCAEMVDTINTDEFEFVQGSVEGAAIIAEKNGNLTWKIGNIPENTKCITFKVKPKDTASGMNLHTNRDVTLTYVDPNGNDQKIEKEQIGDPVVDVAVKTTELSYKIQYYKNGVLVDTDTQSEKETVPVGTTTLHVDKDQINTTDKYGKGFVLDRTEPAVIPDEIEDQGFIKVYYATDQKGVPDGGGDGIPDQYQATATYHVSHGTWADGTVEDQTEIVTLRRKDENGEWQESKAVLQNIPTNMKPYNGYKIGSWNPEPNTQDPVTGNASYTYTFAPINSVVTVAKEATNWTAGSGPLEVGQKILYAITVKNVGDTVKNTSVVVKELLDNAVIIENTEPGSQYEISSDKTTAIISSLAGGQTVVIKAEYVIQEQDLDRGSVINRVSVTTPDLPGITPVEDAAIVPVKPKAVPFKIEHYKEEKVSGTYQYPEAASETENKSGEAGTTIGSEAFKKTYQGYVFDQADPVTTEISDDGTTVIKLYYALDDKGQAPDGGDGIPDKYQAFVHYAAEKGGEVTETFEDFDLRQNGTAALKNSITLKGSTAKADHNYRFSAWTDAPTSGLTIQEKNQANLKGTLNNVQGGDVYTFTAHFTRIGGGGGGDHHHHETPDKPVLNTKDHYSYMIGYKDGFLRPYGTITRGEVSTIFFRLLLDDVRDEYWCQTNRYGDVPADMWCNNAISTLTSMGIIDGYHDGDFKPYTPITRAQFAKMAVNFFHSIPEDYQGYFPDVKEGEWYTQYVEAAVREGLIQGFEDGNFYPDRLITRAQACVIVNRALDRHPDADHLLPEEKMITWVDNNPEDWFYADMQEATNSHDYHMTSSTIKDAGGHRKVQVEEWTRKLDQRDWAALEHVWSTAHSAVGGGEVLNKTNRK